MNMINRIKSDRISAMKDRDHIKKTTLTTLLGDIETLSKKGNVGDEEVIRVVKKHITGLQEVLPMSNDPGRCQQEITILTEYLPTQLSHEDIELILDSAVEQGIIDGIGGAMKYMKEKHAGEYDGKVASKIAKSMFDK